VQEQRGQHKQVPHVWQKAEGFEQDTFGWCRIGLKHYILTVPGTVMGMTKVNEVLSHITPLFSLNLVATVFTTTFVLIVDGANDLMKKVKK
jgi:hypothetical protein